MVILAETTTRVPTLASYLRMSNISLDIWFLLLLIFSKYPQNLHCFYKEAEKDVSRYFHIL